MAVELEFDPFAPEIRADPYPTYKRMREEAPIYWRPDGSPMFSSPHRGLAHGRVRYVGDPVAMVIAETIGQARDAEHRVAHRPLRRGARDRGLRRRQRDALPACNPPPAGRATPMP